MKTNTVTDEDIILEAYNYCATPSMPDGEPEMRQDYYKCFIDGARWVMDQYMPGKEPRFLPMDENMDV